MENLNISIDLKKLELAGVSTLNGKRCVVIPVEENDLYVTQNQDGTVKSVYLNLSVYARREVGQYGDTHNVKQGLSKAFKEKIGAEAARARPYLGNGKPMQLNSAPQGGGEPATQTSASAKGGASEPLFGGDVDDLPF